MLKSLHDDYNEEAKLLALGVPFAKAYKFDADWKKEKNRKEWA